MKTRTEQILVVLKIVAWITMIGLSIEVGSKIISFIVSYFNPVAAKDLYKGLSYYELRVNHSWLYHMVMSLVIIIGMLKVEVWIRVIQLFSDFNLQNPFKMSVAKLLEKIGYSLLTIAILGVIGNGFINWINHHYSLDYSKSFSVEESLIMAGLVYIISQVFKRGIEIQEENELTV